MISCKDNRDIKLVEKEQDIKNYYSSVLHRKPTKNGIIIILQNQRCSSCRLSTFQKLTKLLINNTLPKVVLLSKYDSILEQTISIIPKSNIMIDSSNSLKDYGLDYSTDLFFLYKNAKLEKWFEISNDNLDSLSSVKLQ